MRSGVPSSRITRPEPSSWIASKSNTSLSQQISSLCPSSAPASMAPRSWWHELVVSVAAADAHAFVRKCHCAGLVAGCDQITRPAVERDMKFRRRKARARDNRLEIASQKSLRLAQTPDAQGLKVLLEEGARGFRILRPQVRGPAADVR